MLSKNLEVHKDMIKIKLVIPESLMEIQMETLIEVEPAVQMVQVAQAMTLEIEQLWIK